MRNRILAVSTVFLCGASACASLLRTSNPPKRVLSFMLDTTRYVAIVTLTDDRPELVPADQRNSPGYQ